MIIDDSRNFQHCIRLSASSDRLNVVLYESLTTNSVILEIVSDEVLVALEFLSNFSRW